MGIVEELVRGREAFERREWAGAYEQLSGVDPERLSRDDLLRLGMSAYLLGDNDGCVRVLQQAYQAELDADEPLGAVRIAFWLGLVLLTSGNAAVAGGWVARAHRLLETQPENLVERGYVLIHDMHQRISEGDLPAAASIAPRITEIGRRFGDPDLVALGLCSEGRLLLYAGRAAEGVALFDEAMVGVASSEVSPVIAGQVYCTMIEGCQEISDLGRAEEWTAALSRWCESQPDLVPFTGQCAVHRGQIMRLHGAFAAALEEFDLACRRYVASGWSPAAGLALAEQGDVLRICGRHAEAEAAYSAASGYGHDPQPGLALLSLAEGRTGAAEATARRLLDETPQQVHRTRLLPAATEILLAAGDIDAARSAMQEMQQLATTFGCTALRAMAAYAAGLVHLSASDAAQALSEGRRSQQLWMRLDAPFETARTRMLIGLAFRELGDDESAAGELTAARRGFHELGARPWVAEVDALLHHQPRPGGLTAREVEVLRLVAKGRTNPQIAADLVLSEKTVARHLSNIFAKLGVGSRTGAAAYAFEHHLR